MHAHSSKQIVSFWLTTILSGVVATVVLVQWVLGESFVEINGKNLSIKNTVKPHVFLPLLLKIAVVAVRVKLLSKVQLRHLITSAIV